MRLSAVACLVPAFSIALTAVSATAAEPSRVLFVTQSEGFTHNAVKRQQQPLAPAEIAMKQLGEQTGLFTVDATQEVEADFTRENLQNYDIVAFYTTGNLPIPEADRDYFFQEWLPTAGHGVIGFHSAADTYHNYEPYWDMIGGTFIGHAWNAGNTVTLRIHDAEHPLSKPFADAAQLESDDFGDPGYRHRDEIYQYRHWQPEQVHVLMSLDYSASPTDKGIRVEDGYHVPVMWARDYGEGKVVFNNLGHNNATWTSQPMLDSIVQSVKWIRGEIEADARPNPDVSAEQEAKARREFEAGDFTLAPPKKSKK